MRGLLLSGGHGTRLRPLTFTGNKHMLPIANKPMLEYGFNHLRNAGIKEIGIILGPIKEGVQEYFGDGRKYGVEITYIEQPEPKGLAHAIMVAEEFLGREPFVMYLGDNLLKQGAKPLITLFNDKKCDFVGAVTKVPDPSRYGVVTFDKYGSVKRFVEKPKEFISDQALIGVYVFNETVFDAIKKIRPSWRGEYEITDTIQYLMESGRKVMIQRVEGWWKDTGKPEDLLEANRLVLDDISPGNLSVYEDGVILQGLLHIGEGTYIYKDAIIRGPSIIGENCTIGSDVYIGPYTSIGNNSEISEARIENSIIMKGTLIDSDYRIIDSIIGRNVEIKSSRKNNLKGHKMILGDMSKISI